MGRFNRRNPASVHLSNEHAAILRAIGMINYAASRKSVLAMLLDRVVPQYLEERTPEEKREIEKWAKTFRTYGEKASPLSPNIINLAQRRQARDHAKRRERL